MPTQTHLAMRFYNFKYFSFLLFFSSNILLFFCRFRLERAVQTALTWMNKRLVLLHTIVGGLLHTQMSVVPCGHT